MMSCMLYAVSHCMCVRLMHEVQHEAARWEQVRIRRLFGPVLRGAQACARLVVEGSVCKACRGNCTGDRQPLVLPSHSGKVVPPKVEVANTAHL